MKIIVEEGDTFTGLEPGTYEIGTHQFCLESEIASNFSIREEGPLTLTLVGELKKRIAAECTFHAECAFPFIPGKRRPRPWAAPTRMDRMILDDPVSDRPIPDEQRRQFLDEFTRLPRSWGAQCLSCKLPRSRCTCELEAVNFVAATEPVCKQSLTCYVNLDNCDECGGSGEWENPANGRRSPCSRGCKP